MEFYDEEGLLGSKKSDGADLQSVPDANDKDPLFTPVPPLLTRLPIASGVGMGSGGREELRMMNNPLSMDSRWPDGPPLPRVSSLVASPSGHHRPERGQGQYTLKMKN